MSSRHIYYVVGYRRDGSALVLEQAVGRERAERRAELLRSCEGYDRIAVERGVALRECDRWKPRLLRLTEDAVREIRRLREEGWRETELAQRYGVSQQTISDVCLGRSWQHVS